MKLAIVHFQPLEYYPPTMNFINYVGDTKNFEVLVISTHNSMGKEVYQDEQVKIYRTALPIPEESDLIRVLKYWAFNLVSIWNLVLFRPKVILYYESYSAFPVYVYKRFFNKNVKIFIHFHEYFSKEWYSKGMKLIRWYNQFEKRFLWPSAIKISQTNEERVRLFLTDNIELGKNQMLVLPNYPPMSWQVTPKAKAIELPVSMVYVGHTMNFSTMYVKEVLQWTKSMHGKVKLDCYLQILDHDVVKYLKNHKIENVTINRSVAYNDLPVFLSKYDIGLIFYKCISDNVKYCASNKLFEYLNNGLDVWFSEEMVGTYPYITKDTFPKVLPINFQNLDRIDLHSHLSRNGLLYQPTNYFCEPVYESFCEQLINNE